MFQSSDRIEKTDLYLSPNSQKKRTVFFSMNPDNFYVENLYKVINNICDKIEMVSAIPTELVSHTSRTEDSLEKIANTSVVIADLIKPDPYVAYDLGIADALSIPTLLIYKDYNNLPADFRGMRAIQYTPSPGGSPTQQFFDIMYSSLSRILESDSPEVIDSFRKRTKAIIRDLDQLRTAGGHDATIWYSGVFSDFAMDKSNLEDPEEKNFAEDLMKEKEIMIQLAAAGYHIICIITPPTPDTLVVKFLDVVIKRTKHLIAFIENHEPQKETIEWILSPFRQKNCYIIGDISFIERFQKNVAQGVDITLRLTGNSAIHSCREVYENLRKALLDDLSERRKFPNGIPEDPSALRMELRAIALEELKNRLKEYEDIPRRNW